MGRRHAGSQGALDQEVGRFLKAVQKPDPPPELYGTPLFITLFVSLWMAAPPEEERRLPDTWGALYREAVNLLLEVDPPA